MGAVLALQGVKVREGRNLILDLPEFSVGRGEVLALVGPNGAGKSTLLRTLALLQRPAQGRVFFAGQPVEPARALPIRRRLAMVMQEALLLDGSVSYNVALGLKLRGVPSAERAERVAGWLRKFGVSHLAERHVRGLSGGEAQRVNLARALALEPEVLFLDEPFTFLDAPTREALLEELGSVLRDTGLTAVFVTHDAAELPRRVDRLVVIEGGRVIGDSDPAEILAAPPTPFLRAFFHLP